MKTETPSLIILTLLLTPVFVPVAQLAGEETADLEIKSAHKISFTSNPNKDYQIQHSHDLDTWNNDGAPILGSGKIISRYYENTENLAFYRLSITEYQTPRQWHLPYSGDFKNTDTIALNGPGIDRIAIFPIDLSAKYVVSGDVKVNGYAGFVIGYNEALKRYASVYSGNGGTEIWRYAGQSRDYSTTLAHDWSPGSWIPFRIERDGGLYLIGINGVQIAYTLAGSEYGNQFGLLAQFDNKVEIRNFQYSIDGNPTPPPPTDPPSGSLAILEATYGANGSLIYVRTILEESIVDNAIDLDVSNTNMGGDPVFGVVKELFVRYTVDGAEFSKTVTEGETLTLP